MALTVLSGLRTELKRALGDKYLIEVAEGGEDALELVEELIAENSLSPHTFCIMLIGQADIGAIANAINYARLYRYLVCNTFFGVPRQR